MAVAACMQPEHIHCDFYTAHALPSNRQHKNTTHPIPRVGQISWWQNKSRPTDQKHLHKNTLLLFTRALINFARNFASQETELPQKRNAQRNAKPLFYLGKFSLSECNCALTVGWDRWSHSPMMIFFFLFDFFSLCDFELNAMRIIWTLNIGYVMYRYAQPNQLQTK